MSRRVVPIVEGHGEVEALPVLIRRLTLEHLWQHVEVSPPWRMHRSAMIHRGDELAKAARAARIRAGHGGLVMLVLDADEECPRDLGPTLLQRVRAAAGDPVSCVVPCREFEAWFIAAAPSVAGKRGLALPLAVPAHPEGIGDAKGWLSDQMGAGRRYSPTSDQAPLAGAMDLELARANAPSLDKLWRDLEAWLVTPPERP